MNLIFQDVLPSDSGQYECQVKLLKRKYFSGCQNLKKRKMLKLQNKNASQVNTVPHLSHTISLRVVGENHSLSLSLS